MNMISYAQNYEDVILARAFATKTNGFYVDIGACYPENGSVTKHFYDLGWSGVNVEPHPDAFRLLANARTRDINLNIAVADYDGEIKLYFGDSIGETTALEGEDSKSFIVPALSLMSLFEKYVREDVDFLKIDVEGYEYQVLKGGDWKKFRPKVIVCEVTQPWSNKIRSEAENIKLLLTSEDYQLTYFDGLNWYFVANEANNLAELIGLQPNVLDNYITICEQTLVKDLTEAQKRINSYEQTLADYQKIQNQLSEVWADRERAQNQLNEVWADRERILNSRSWRLTAPFRALVEKMHVWKNRLFIIVNRPSAIRLHRFNEYIKLLIRRSFILFKKIFISIAPGLYARLSGNKTLYRIYARILKSNTQAPAIYNSKNYNKIDAALRQKLEQEVQEWRLGERIND